MYLLFTLYVLTHVEIRMYVFVFEMYTFIYVVTTTEKKTLNKLNKRKR